MTIQVTASLTAENTFSDALAVQGGDTVAISASGVTTNSNTVTLQRSFDGTNWLDVDSFDVDTETGYECDCSHELRIGIKTGGFTGGTTVVLLRKPQ